MAAAARASSLPVSDRHKPLQSVPQGSGASNMGKLSWAFCGFLGLFLFATFHVHETGIPNRALGRVFKRLESLEQRVQRILACNPLIDGHVDLPMSLREKYLNRIDNPDWYQSFENGTLKGHVDLARLRKGQSGGAFWSVYAPCPARPDNFTDENLAASVQITLDQIDVMTRIFDAYPGDFAAGVNSSNAVKDFKQGKFISPMGIEGLHQIGNSVANLRLYYKLGVRYATLTHNCHNIYADAAVLDYPKSRKAEPKWGGVSNLGRELIREMNRIGMIVDLAHVGDDTMIQALAGNDSWAGSRAPVIFSHSSAYAICPHPRNVKDNVLQLVKKRDSLVMVNAYPDFIACVATAEESGIPKPIPEEATLEKFVDHIVYIGELIGYDYVGIGLDFDGVPTLPKGLEDASKYPDLVLELLKRGISEEDVIKIIGGNLIRVWKAVDATSAEMKAEGTPVMEDVRQSLE